MTKKEKTQLSVKTSERVPTGIPGFDKLLEGGFPRDKSILITGTPGTGKTIFALQYLHEGATKYSEKGLYVSLEENSENLRKQAKQFGWDYKTLENSGKVRILDIAPGDIKDTTANEIVTLAHRDGYKRVVIDSLSALAINTPAIYAGPSDITDISIKRFVYRFVHLLRSNRLTSLLISQSSSGRLSTDEVSEFVCDGIINIQHEPMGGQYSRHLTIKKMREVANDEDIHPLEIAKNGIHIHDLE